MKSIKKGGLNRRISLGLAGAKGGLGLLQAKAGSWLLPKDEQKAHTDKALEREANRFVEHIGELKGAYVKIGQMLALYGEHILPTPVTNALHTLEASTKPLEWAAVSPVLEEEWSETSLEQLQVESEPIAAASLSQVHRADLDGEAVCIKIQYPGIADAIEDDFKNVMQMLTLAKWVKSGRQLEQLTQNLKRYLMSEVDYSHELKTAQQVAVKLEGDQRYKVPNYFPEYSTKKVLTMEYVDGYDVTHTKVQALSQDRRNAIAEAMLELFFKEAFEWNLMQTDPNFGNYRIIIDESKEQKDRLVLLDFGAVHELEPAFSSSLRKTILAAQAQELELVIDGLVEIGCLDKEDSDEVKQSFGEFCIYILEPFRSSFEGVPDHALDDNNYCWKSSNLLKRAGKLGTQQVLLKGFKVPPPEFMLMVRKLTGVFTFVSALGAKTNSSGLLDAYR